MNELPPCVVCHGPVARTSHWARKTCSVACRSAARRAAGQISAANVVGLIHPGTSVPETEPMRK